MQLRALTFDELVDRGVDRRFAQILSYPDSYHPDLRILIGKTDWNYFVPPGVTDVVPLWDSNSDSFVRWTRNGATSYVWLFHDDPDWSAVAASEQGIKGKLWQDWIEFQDADEDECYRFAAAIGFRHCKEGLAKLDREYDEFKKWLLELTDDRT